MNNLFTSVEEKNAIENLLAMRKLAETELEEGSFVEEIRDYLDKCTEIFDIEGGRVNYAAEILARRVEKPDIYIKGVSPEYDATNRAAEIAALEKEFQAFLEAASRNNSEDIQFYYNVINDRLNRIDDLKEKRSLIESSVPDLHNFKYEELATELSGFFKTVDSFLPETKLKEAPEKEEVIVKEENLTSEDKTLVKPIVTLSDEEKEPELEEEPIMYEEVDLTTPDKVRHEVIGIKSPQTLEDEIKIESPEVVSDVKIEKPEVVEDIKVEEPIKESKLDDIFEPGYEEELDSMLSFKNLELEKDFVTDEPFDLKSYDSDIIEPEAPEEVEKRPLDRIVPLEEIKAEEKKEEPEVFPYEMPEGFSLVDIALELYQDADLWLDIYKANQEVFNTMVKDVRNGNFDNIENDKKIFSGLTINFPVPKVEKTQTEKVL